jgi:hypothetical protein
MGIYPLVTSEYWLTEEELVDIAANDENVKRKLYHFRTRHQTEQDLVCADARYVEEVHKFTRSLD